ncbi:hypothetical protein QYM36_019993 [Artemia franciscana]|uniref:ENTH domain-containing protein n=1 Tax=Artemia franciscana TaxID=6661 RepID=A0AA88H0I0_ARTSF|nr:hypothetical protein QYM36_019993 [Artemia franciscana]
MHVNSPEAISCQLKLFDIQIDKGDFIAANETHENIHKYFGKFSDELQADESLSKLRDLIYHSKSHVDMATEYLQKEFFSRKIQYHSKSHVDMATEYLQKEYFSRKIQFKDTFRRQKGRMENKLLHYNSVEKLKRKATCNDIIYPKVEIMAELAAYTYQSTYCHQILDIFKKRILKKNIGSMSIRH